MTKIKREKIVAIQFVQACGGDIFQAIEKLENLIDSLFISGQRKKAQKVEKILLIVKKEF